MHKEDIENGKFLALYDIVRALSKLQALKMQQIMC